MTFCLCQRFNVKKKIGHQFVELNKNAGFKFSWNCSSYLPGVDQTYFVYKIEMSKINERFQLDSVHLKTEKSTYEVDPIKVVTVAIGEGDPKLLNLRVVWRFKNGYGTKSISNSTKNMSNIFNLCQRLTIQKNGKIFVKLNDALGFTFFWEQYGKSYRKEKHYVQLYHFKVSEMYNGLQFEDIELKYQNSTFTMSAGVVTTVEMLEDCPKPIELNVLWSFENSFGEAKTDSGNSNVAYLKKVLQEQKEDSDDQQKKKESEDKYIFRYIPSTPSTETVPKIATVEENEAPKIHDDNSDLSTTTSPLVDVFTSKKYSDVIFLTNDSKKVFAHRCILFTFSDIFVALFDRSSDIPVEIEVDFPEAIITRAIEFCYGKSDGIQNSEENLIKFADKYGVKGLKKVCLKSLKDRPLTTENVCKIVEIAFEQNYTLLKQKCLQFILEKKNELGEKKLSKLPIEILVSTILSL